MSFASTESKELKVRLSYVLPVDPSLVQTMADYDLSLILSRTWFDYDESRKAIPGLIQSWEFDSKKGGYHFKINPKAKWSDGKSLTASELYENLKKGIENPKSTYGIGMKGIINLSTFHKKNESEFFIGTFSKKPTAAFFQRMGSIFWSVVAPEDFAENLFDKIKGNSRSLGPYVIKSVAKDEIILKQNPYFLGELSQAPTSIHIKKVNDSFDLNDFLENKTWENYIQINTLLDSDLGTKLINKKFPMWTRGSDRISLLKPYGEGETLKKRQLLGLLIAKTFHETKTSLTFSVRKALSIQPLGYPLHNDFDYAKIKIDSSQLPKKIKILSYVSSFHDYHKKALEPVFKDLGLSVEWDLKNRGEYLTLLFADKESDHDFALSGFGVADPEPATWLGLIFGSKFIKFSKFDGNEFSKIASHKADGNEVEDFKSLISKIQKEGGFVPLFFFSTLSIGKPPMDFSKIRELDETVDYSKIIFK
ncbi:MAG: ABC transporter substrate-binding protein [Bdellovibrio sp.]